MLPKFRDATLHRVIHKRPLATLRGRFQPNVADTPSGPQFVRPGSATELAPHKHTQGKILDGFFNLVSVVFPLVFIVAFLYTQKKVLNELIMEKETKVRESLRMLGVRSTATFGRCPGGKLKRISIGSRLRGSHMAGLEAGISLAKARSGLHRTIARHSTSAPGPHQCRRSHGELFRGSVRSPPLGVPRDSWQERAPWFKRNSGRSSLWPAMDCSGNRHPIGGCPPDTREAIFGSWYITYGIIFGMLCAVFAAIASRQVLGSAGGGGPALKTSVGGRSGGRPEAAHHLVPEQRQCSTSAVPE